jgi:hypothetical protein
MVYNEGMSKVNTPVLYFDVEGSPVRRQGPTATPEMYCGEGRWKPLSSISKLAYSTQISKSDFEKLVTGFDHPAIQSAADRQNAEVVAAEPVAPRRKFAAVAGNEQTKLVEREHEPA